MINIRTTKKSPNYGKGRGNWKPDIIVCHISEGYYESGCDWLCNPASEASTHYFISKKGEITQLVDLQDAAWGNGTTVDASASRYYGNSNLQVVRERKASANNYTISIEHEGFYKDSKGSLTEAQLSATVDLIGHIRNEVKKIFGIDIPIDRQHIVGHCDIAPKWKPNCPGQNFPFDEIIKRLKDKNITQKAEYKVSEANLKALSDCGVIISPEYWRGVSLQYLDELFSNAAQSGVLDKRIHNGITDIDTAFDVLVNANIILSPDYWKKCIKDGKILYIKELLINIANKCRIILEKIVEAEAGGEDEQGKTLVANVIMNRVKSKGFPNSIREVVFESSVKDNKTVYQFTPIRDKRYFTAVPSPSTKQAINKALSGTDYSREALFFCSFESTKNPGNWHENNLTFLFRHGGHCFYK